MQALHIPTLMAVLQVVSLSLGVFLLANWRSRDERRLYFWLGLAGLAGSFGCLLLMGRDRLPDWASVWAAHTLLLAGNGFVWAAIRTLENRPPPLLPIIAGVLIWSIACLYPPFFQSISARATVICILGIAYYSSITLEATNGFRDEPSVSHTIVAVLAVIHTLTYLVRLATVIQGADGHWPSAEHNPWIAFLIIESIVSTIGLSLTMTITECDRAERLQRRAASIDMLTNANNRRAFVEQARALVETEGRAASLILFDLDCFKSINDTFGHAAGDRTLVAFADLITRHLQVADAMAEFDVWRNSNPGDAQSMSRPHAIFGRIGGEEFACLLPNHAMASAATIADDIRQAFKELVLLEGDRRIPTSVSAGVISTLEAGLDFEQLLALADKGLYRAKHLGRNRVELGAAPAGHVPADPLRQSSFA